MAIPFVWMISSSFKPLDEIFMRPPTVFPVAPTLVNYETAFGTGTFLQAFFNSFYIATVITVVSLLTCAMAAYAFARMQFPGNNLLFGLFLATMMVPIQLTIIPLYTIMGWFQLVDTHAAIILPAALFNAFGVFLLRQYVRGIPLELEEAAAIDGASRIKIFTTMILPLLRTPMVALGIFMFLGQWNNFFYPLIFLNTDTLFTLPLWVNQFKGAVLGRLGWLDGRHHARRGAVPDHLHHRSAADRGGHRALRLEDLGGRLGLVRRPCVRRRRRTPRPGVDTCSRRRGRDGPEPAGDTSAAVPASGPAAPAGAPDRFPLCHDRVVRNRRLGSIRRWSTADCGHRPHCGRRSATPSGAWSDSGVPAGPSA